MPNHLAVLNPLEEGLIHEIWRPLVTSQSIAQMSIPNNKRSISPHVQASEVSSTLVAEPRSRSQPQPLVVGLGRMYRNSQISRFQNTAGWCNGSTSSKYHRYCCEEKLERAFWTPGRYVFTEEDLGSIPNLANQSIIFCLSIL